MGDWVAIQNPTAPYLSSNALVDYRYIWRFRAERDAWGSVRTIHTPPLPPSFYVSDVSSFFASSTNLLRGCLIEEPQTLCECAAIQLLTSGVCRLEKIPEATYHLQRALCRLPYPVKIVPEVGSPSGCKRPERFHGSTPFPESPTSTFVYDTWKSRGTVVSFRIRTPTPTGYLLMARFDCEK